MDLTELPFNRLLKLRRASDPEALLSLDESPRLHNHLGTFHASALFSLAEASSAEFLLRHRGARDDIGGVVRRASCKYSSPAHGTITGFSATSPDTVHDGIAAVESKGRALCPSEIDLRNESGVTVARFSFTWFLTPV